MVVGNLAMWCEELALHHFHPHDYHAAVAYVPNRVMPAESVLDGIESLGSTAASYPERLGLSNTVGPTCFPEINMADFRSISGTQHNYYDHLLEGEYCSTELVSNFWPAASGYNPVANDNVEVLTFPNKADEAEVTTMTKVGKYSVEERKYKIMKYLKKRNQRNFNKTIKYACRKTLADKRVRVRGRFAKNSDLPHEASHEVEEDQLETLQMKNMHGCCRNIACCHEQQELFNNCHVHQMKKKQEYDEENEDWLQEAMATLMYSPHVLMDGSLY